MAIVIRFLKTHISNYWQKIVKLSVYVFLNILLKTVILNYSRTSIYRTRLIGTSAFIEVGLWSRPRAIIKGGKSIGFMQHGYCILFVFMLVLYWFCVATEFSVNKDLYIEFPAISSKQRRPRHPQSSFFIEGRGVTFINYSSANCLRLTIVL